MSMSRPHGRVTPRETDLFKGRRGEAYRPMEIIIKNVGPYKIEWNTRNRHTAGIHKYYELEPGQSTEEYADFISLKFGDWRIPEGTAEWSSMLRKVAQRNRGGCIPFVKIFAKGEKGKQGDLLWDGKDQFKKYINSQAGIQHLIGGTRLPIPSRVKRMSRKELIALSIKAHFPLDCIKEDTDRWPNIRIMRVLTTKCSPEFLDDILEMSLADYGRDDGEDDGTTLAGTGTEGSGQDKQT